MLLGTADGLPEGDCERDGLSLGLSDGTEDGARVLPFPLPLEDKKIVPSRLAWIGATRNSPRTMITCPRKKRLFIFLRMKMSVIVYYETIGE